MLNLNPVSCGAAVLSATALFVGSNQDALADTQVAIDGGTASGLCATAYPGTSGPDQLSSCQWDMQVINACDRRHHR